MPVLVAFGSFVTTLLGGVAALRIGDRRHLVLGLAAGLMLGVVLFDLLPEALGEQPGVLFGVPRVMLVTMAGFLTLHVIERAASVHRGHEAEYAGHQHHPGIGLFAASGLVGHSLMDGFAIGAAFQAGIKFHAAGLVDGKERATLSLNAAVEHIEHAFLRFKFGDEVLVELFGAAHLEGLENHDRPGGDGEENEADNNGLGFRCGLLPHIKQLGLIVVCGG